jgi:hypothetical protein
MTVLNGEQWCPSPLQECSKISEKVLTPHCHFETVPHTQKPKHNKHMRTKTLLLTAAVVAAGVAASQAQVYSVNAVGYINVVCKPGFNLIADQLITSNTTVAALFPNVPGGSQVLKWAGSGFTINNYDPDFQEWDNPNQTVGIGEGCFLFNPTTTNITVTFVGDVPQGNLTNSIPHNYSLQSSQVPQAGKLQTDLGYIPSPNDTVLRWNNGYPGPSGYLIYTYDADFLEWDLEPTLNVGEGFFILRNAPGVGAWTRQFSVN